MSRRAWQLLASLLAPRRGSVALAVALAVAATVTGLAPPALVGYAIDNGILPGNARPVLVAAAGIGAAVIVGALARFALTRLTARLGEAMLAQLRERVFAHLLDLPLRFHEQSRKGALMARVTADVEAVRLVARHGLVETAVAALQLIAVAIALIVLSPLLAGLLLLAAPPLWWLSRWFARRIGPGYRRYRHRIARTGARLQDAFAGYQELTACGALERQHRRTRSGSRAERRTVAHCYAIENRFFPGLELAEAGLGALALLAGGALGVAGVVSVGVVTAFVLYLRDLFGPVEELSMWFDELQSAGAALDALAAILAQPCPIQPAPQSPALPSRGQLVLQSVAFGYGPERREIDGVDLTLAQGERLALVGRSGAGKTTLARLMAKLLVPDEGWVCYGGVDLARVPLSAVRQRIVLAPQDGHVIAGTVAGNLRLVAPEATDEQLAAALERLGLANRLALDREVGAGGAALSAGERQLLALARLALLDPAVVTLDEATGALDPETEAEVDAALQELLAGRTTIIIAHRLLTAWRCDRVAVLEDGRISEMGTPAELATAGGSFATLQPYPEPA